MRVVHSDVSLINGLLSARAEAQAAFGDATVYLERHVSGARHVEVQLLGDTYGNFVHLGERDCSLQRRHQKLVEESPSPHLDDGIRRKICDAALRLAKAAEYANAGTAEFLVAPDGQFYFLEVNARVQVEHPVTEMVTGVDIVKEQIRVAAKERIWFEQGDISVRGAAIECRINAEDPERNFAPSPGRVEFYYPPGGPNVRVDSHLYAGYCIPPYYDSLIAKVIVHRPTRRQAVATMRRALSEFVIDGVRTTIPFCLEVFGHTRFIRGNVDTNFIESDFLSRSP